MGKAMKKKQSGLSVKIFIYMLGFSLLMLIILWLFQTVFLDSFYRSIKLNEVEKQAATLAEYVRQNDLDALGEVVRTRGDMSIEVLDAEGNNHTSSDSFLEVPFYSLSATQKAQLFAVTVENGGSITIFPSAGDTPDALPPKEPQPRDTEPQPEAPWGELETSHLPGFNPSRQMDRIIYAEIVTVQATGEERLLLLTAAITPVGATVETLRIQLVYISVIMLVLAIGIAILLARRVAKPIEQLNRSAKELGRGNYDTSFEGTGYREISELSATLGHAAVELSKTEALRQELIANVSHDLRTPLTLVTGYAEMIRDIPGEDTPENMQVIIDEATRLSRLVSDLLDLSRIQSGTAEMHFEAFSLGDEIQSIIDRFSKFSEPEGFTIQFRRQAEATVTADAARIDQVLYNFLANAMNHGGGSKTIQVHLRRENGRALVEVADDGPGIPEENQPYIWDRYFKAEKPDTVHKRAMAGSGLGLSIVKNILQQHPGVQFGVRSQPGQGSTFWFSMPVAP